LKLRCAKPLAALFEFQQQVGSSLQEMPTAYPPLGREHDAAPIRRAAWRAGLGVLAVALPIANAYPADAGKDDLKIDWTAEYRLLGLRPDVLQNPVLLTRPANLPAKKRANPAVSIAPPGTTPHKPQPHPRNAQHRANPAAKPAVGAATAHPSPLLD
jgi:hypothetical protein